MKNQKNNVVRWTVWVITIVFITIAGVFFLDFLSFFDRLFMTYFDQHLAESKLATLIVALLCLAIAIAIAAVSGFILDKTQADHKEIDFKNNSDGSITIRTGSKYITAETGEDGSITLRTDNGPVLKGI
ncbi:hypothetical protein [Candidatus Absconditicoccus praedator]|uniref:hypothetical protein n=1 Tax=Candidatus Absconditicoccus praedator TaxID=2735562 RepID=UPI001E33D108|nr:hypothetical protein [Candidatus Absconditicoccus praedator]UFX82614.1 hypothetical protein HLG78_00475 [Candidatus Absconditicoccus praedator]